MTTPRKLPAEGGFLLIESLIALALLTGGLLAALEAFWASSRAIRRATELSARTQCAQEKFLETLIDRPIRSGACADGVEAISLDLTPL